MMSQSRCSGSSGSSRAAAAAAERQQSGSTWLRRHAASQWHSASTWLREAAHPAQLPLGGKVLPCPLSSAAEPIVIISEWLREDALQLEDTFLIWSRRVSVRWPRGNVMPLLCASWSPPSSRSSSVFFPPLPPCADFCLGPFWHARVERAGISHPPPMLSPAVWWTCCSAPHLTRRLPGQNKGINHELHSHQETQCANGQGAVRSVES